MCGFTARIALLLFALLLAACAEVVPMPVAEAPLLWPPAPDPPRIAHVMSFAQPADLGIQRGFFQRIADALFGGSESRLQRPMAVVVAVALIVIDVDCATAAATVKVTTWALSAFPSPSTDQ